MRHHDNRRKLGREKNQRVALMRSLALSLINKKKIVTTEAKARELRPFIEKVITLGKTESVARAKLLASKLDNTKIHRKIFEIAKGYAERNGGYTRVTKLPLRKSDGAKMAAIEFV